MDGSWKITTKRTVRHRRPGTITPDMNRKLNFELAKQIYKLAPRVGTSSYALVAVIAYVFWDLLSPPLLWSWIILTTLVTTVFLYAIYLFNRHASEKTADYWIKVYAWMVVIHDIPLGLIGPMGFMVDNNLYQVLTLFMLAGMSAGAIVTRGVVFRIYVIAVVTLLLPTIIVLALETTDIAIGMLVLTIIFFFFLLSVAKNYSATITNNFLLWLDNEKLVGQLTQSHIEVEETNRVLTREIEHRKKIESELVDAKERSERASEAKNQFLANVSHELRTPLNGIIGFSDLLNSEYLEEKPKRFANQIGRSAQSLLRIVNDILDITAIEAGHITFYEAPFALRNEIEDVVNILRPMAARKDLTLECKVDDEVENGLYGDANRLRQIISNLVSNAVKYTKSGGVTVNVSRQGEHDDQVVVRFEVRDTGVGIAEEALNSIFENFTRIEGFETRHNEGVGLGLAIVKSLVQRMDGVIKVESVVGKGSCFCVEIPFVRTIEVPKSQESSIQSTLTPEQYAELRVLVVDDNDVNRMVLGAFLKKSEIPFEEVDNGHDAMARIREGGFDVVLMDIQMPEISGIEVVLRLQEEKILLPVLIAVTAHAFPEQRQAILDAGFADFLIKPISESSLLKTLTKAYLGGYAEKEIKGKRPA